MATRPPDRPASADAARRGSAEEAGEPMHVHLGVESEKSREVATRFSSAKPAPEGACVRSPSTHQRAVRAAAELEGEEVQEVAARAA